MDNGVMRVLSAYPTPRLWALPGQSRGSVEGALHGFDALYASGRDAIYWFFRHLSPGRVAWMPAFHCGVEVQAAMDAGFSVDFYRVRQDLSVDEQDLEAKLRSSPGPVLVIHYFGFPQPAIERISRMCALLQVPMLEDCAHALFSAHGERPLGSFGTAAIYSLRKTLPIFDGGALTAGLAGKSVCSLPPKPVLAEAVKTATRSLLPPSATKLYRRLRWGEEAKGIEDSEERVNRVIPEVRNYHHSMSGVSRALASRCDVAEIVQQRRHNWMRLASSAILGSAVYQSLPVGVCPLFFPVWSEHRTRVMAELARRGIETFVFGEFAHPALDVAAFPESAHLRDRILALPVHQQLGDHDMDRIVRSWQESIG